MSQTHQMMKNNPMMKGMDPEQMEKQLEMMANMKPEQLQQMMKMAQRVQGVTAPVMQAYSKVDQWTNGHAKSVVALVVAVIVCWIIDYFTRGSSAAPGGSQLHHSGV